MPKKNYRSTAPEHRTFGGESFQGIGEWDSKAYMQKRAAKRRKYGYKTRVVKHGTGWVLYIKATSKVKYPLPPDINKV